MNTKPRHIRWSVPLTPGKLNGETLTVQVTEGLQIRVWQTGRVDDTLPMLSPAAARLLAEALVSAVRYAQGRLR